MLHLYLTVYKLIVYLFCFCFAYFFLSLKPIDIVVLKKLSEVVNVVPVIAKSDSLTIDERAAFKQRVIITIFFFFF